MEDRTGYDRVREFGSGWTDADRDGCNTRMEVLLQEAVVPTKTGRCTLDVGRWYSWYDDTWIDGPRGLDIDHVRGASPTQTIWATTGTWRPSASAPTARRPTRTSPSGCRWSPCAAST
ncbi:hypothetical protein [Streptomyces coeruleorubidus]|uniref:hypothetical protein n=1 Tax=Streptomyces coeruleorubidus TaxID=116188 RepID=UPI00378A3570